MKLRFKKNMYPGKLIVIEGTDGCGKTTIENEIIEHYKKRSINIIITYQPTGWWREDKNIITTLHKRSGGEVLKDEAVALFALADRVNHQRSCLEPELEQGSVILCNRYVYSLFSYYMAMGTINLEWLKNVAEFVIEPDLSILLHVTPVTAINRIISRDGKNPEALDQNEEIVRKIIGSFIELADKNNIHTISTDCDIKETVENCVRLIDKVIY